MCKSTICVRQLIPSTDMALIFLMELLSASKKRTQNPALSYRITFLTIVFLIKCFVSISVLLRSWVVSFYVPQNIFYQVISRTAKAVIC
jgi:hypothetical protein